MAGCDESKLRLQDLVIEPALSPIPCSGSDGNVGELLAEKEVQMAAIMERYMQIWLERTHHSLGFPLNSNFNYCDLGQLLQFSMNNLGDPFIESNYGVHSRDFEVAILNWFACLWEIGKTDYWGYITNGGTEGNLHGLLVGREVLPQGILYASKDSHYSVFKAARMYRMDCIKIETLTSGEIDYGDLKVRLLQNQDKPAILNINIGTTFKGAIDDIVLVTQTLEECDFPPNRFYIHCDAALAGTMLPFMSQVPLLTFKRPIGSISVSGHKFVGCPMPCGVEIVRLEHINALSKDVEYIASRDATISGSRNGHTPIFLWHALNRKGYHGLRNDVDKCIDNAQYLTNKLKEAGVSAMLNELSNTVVFERPRDEGFVKHWQLACQGNIAHVVVMPNVTKEMLATFLDELVEKRSTWLKDGHKELLCFALEIGEENCACPLHQ